MATATAMRSRWLVSSSGAAAYAVFSRTPGKLEVLDGERIGRDDVRQVDDGAANTRPVDEAVAQGADPAAAARIPTQRQGPVVRIQVDDVDDLDQVAALPARYAQHLGVPLELAEPSLEPADHVARALAIALIDQALVLAWRAAPGLGICRRAGAQSRAWHVRSAASETWHDDPAG
jgi:hypothetical protein